MQCKFPGTAICDTAETHSIPISQIRAGLFDGWIWDCTRYCHGSVVQIVELEDEIFRSDGRDELTANVY